MSRILSGLGSFALAFAAKEVEAMKPYVEKAIAELPSDLTTKQPLVAIGQTISNAITHASNDSGVVPSLTGILGNVAQWAESALFGNKSG